MKSPMTGELLDHILIDVNSHCCHKSQYRRRTRRFYQGACLCKPRREWVFKPIPVGPLM